MLIDAGANAEAKAENLLQFGVMGSVFAEQVLGISSPRVGLLSIGEEATKGSPLTLEAHALLAAAPIDFAGNCEGRDALRGEFRVIVADGFAGNVLLKGLEGAGEALFEELREAAASSSLRAQAGRAAAAAGAARGARPPRPGAYGGAYLLGVRGLSVIAHGNSGRRAIRERDPVRRPRHRVRTWSSAWSRGSPRRAALGRLAGHRSATYSPRRRSTGEWREPAHDS